MTALPLPARDRVVAPDSTPLAGQAINGLATAAAYATPAAGRTSHQRALIARDIIDDRDLCDRLERRLPGLLAHLGGTTNPAADLPRQLAAVLADLTADATTTRQYSANYVDEQGRALRVVCSSRDDARADTCVIDGAVVHGDLEVRDVTVNHTRYETPWRPV